MKEDSGFSAEKLRQLLASEEGRQLMAMLGRDGGKGARQALEAYRKGDLARAQELLRPITDSPESGRLMEKLAQR